MSLLGGPYAIQSCTQAQATSQSSTLTLALSLGGYKRIGGRRVLNCWSCFPLGVPVLHVYIKTWEKWNTISVLKLYFIQIKCSTYWKNINNFPFMCCYFIACYCIQSTPRTHNWNLSLNKFGKEYIEEFTVWNRHGKEWTPLILFYWWKKWKKKKN